MTQLSAELLGFGGDGGALTMTAFAGFFVILLLDMLLEIFGSSI